MSTRAVIAMIETWLVDYDSYQDGDEEAPDPGELLNDAAFLLRRVVE